MKAIRTPFLLIGLCLAMAQHASAASRTFPGAQCTPTDIVNMDSGNMRVNQFGPFSKTSGSLDVICGGNVDGLVTSVLVKVYDRNASATLSCTLRLLDQAGLQVYSASKDTGLPSVTSPSALNLAYSPGGVMAQTGVLECTIPGISGSNASHVTSYQFTF